MDKGKKLLLFYALISVLLLLSYRYSLFADVSQLPMLEHPDTMTPFQRLITYTFMMIGIIPTILIMIGVSFFCHTTYPAGIVTFVCFNQQYSFTDGNGFIVYIIASICTVMAIRYIFTRITDR